MIEISILTASIIILVASVCVIGFGHVAGLIYGDFKTVKRHIAFVARHLQIGEGDGKFRSKKSRQDAQRDAQSAKAKKVQPQQPVRRAKQMHVYRNYIRSN